MSMVDKEKLARLAQALDDRADNKVAKEAERAAQAEAELQAHSEATRDMLGGKSLKYLTQAEYDVLSEEEKQDENIIYYITDLEDRTHDHYNKEVLDLLDDEFVKNLGRGQVLEAIIPAEGGWYRIAKTTEPGVEAYGAQMGLFGIYEYGNGKQSNKLITVSQSNGKEPVIQQLMMDAYEFYRNKKVRVVFIQPSTNRLEAYLEVYYEAKSESELESYLQVQILGDSKWQLVEPVLTEVVDEAVYQTKEMELVPGKIIGEFQGVIEKAGALAEPVQIIFGDVHKEFDGTADIAFSLNEVGAAPRESEILTTDNKVVVEAINELDAGLDVVTEALGGYKIWVGNTEELNAIEERDPMTLYFEISDNINHTLINEGIEEPGIATTEIYDEEVPTFVEEEEVIKDVILVSPSGIKFKLMVDDFGNLSTEPVE